MKRTILLSLVLIAFVCPIAFGQKSIDETTLNQIKKSYKNDVTDKAIRNAIGNCDRSAFQAIPAKRVPIEPPIK